MIMVIKRNVMMLATVVVEVLLLLWVPQLVSLSSLSPWFSLLSSSEEGNVNSVFQSKCIS